MKQGLFKRALTVLASIALIVGGISIITPASADGPVEGQWIHLGDPDDPHTVKYQVHDGTLYIQPNKNSTTAYLASDQLTTFAGEDPKHNNDEIEIWADSNNKPNNFTKIECPVGDHIVFTKTSPTDKISLQGMFGGNTQLTDISGLQCFDTSNVDNMSRMFAGDVKLTNLTPIGKWNVTSVTNMSSMFAGDKSLSDLTQLKNWQPSQIQNTSLMFSTNTTLTTLAGLDNWNVQKLTNPTSMFAGDTNLKDTSALAKWALPANSSSSQIFGSKAGTVVHPLISRQWTKLGVPAASKGGKGLAHAYWMALGKPSTGGAGDTYIYTRDGTVPQNKGYSISQWTTTDAYSYDKALVFERFNPSFWTLQFEANGGNGSMPDQKIMVGKTITIPHSLFYWFGYDFIGWTTQPGAVSDTTNPLITVGTKNWTIKNPQKDQKYQLYAQWKRIIPSGNHPISGPGGMLPGWSQTGATGTQGTMRQDIESHAWFQNRYNPSSTTFSFHLLKMVDGHAPTGSQKYWFDLKNENGTTIDRVQNTGSEVIFPPRTFTHQGSYGYTVNEEKTDVPTTMNRDNHSVSIEVDVHPADSTHKGLWATSQYAGRITFNNTSKPGNLIISKKIVNNTKTIPATNTFTVHVSATDRNGNPLTGTYGNVTFTQGSTDITILGGGSTKISDLPVGTHYIISETNIPDGFHLSTISGSTGVINTNMTSNATLTNTYTVKPTSVTLTFTKNLTVGPKNAVGNITPHTYNFTLCQKENPTDTASQCEGVSSTYAKSDGTISFPPLTYTTANIGVTSYEIVETNNHIHGIKYDTTKHRVNVDVKSNGRGKLSATVQYQDGQSFTNRIPQQGSVPETGRAGVLPFAILCLLIVLLASILLVRRE